MKNKQKETIAQEIEQNKNQNAQELAISSKAEVKSKKKVRKTKKIVNKTHKKQRKGKSLLTSFQINRMGRRMTLDLRRGSIGGKYV